MRNNNVTNRAKNFKLAFAALLIALVGVQVFNTGGYAAPQAKPAQTGELKSATEARNTLARLGSPNFAKVKDARKRDAAQKGYDSIKALANNTSKERERALIAELARTTQVLKSFPRPATRSFEGQCDKRYETCMELCNASDGHANCDLCAMGNNMCYQLGILQEFMHENSGL
jgi:hypothetical protein